MGDLLSDFAEWLMDLLLWVPRKLWAELLDGLATLFEAIPVPDFIATAQSVFNGIPSTMLFFLDKFAFGEGVAMVLSAYLLRFLLRRIPIIG